MVRLTKLAAFILAGTTLVAAQGFENTSYASTPTTSSSVDKKFSIFATVGAGFSLGGEYVGTSDQVEVRTTGTTIVETDDEYVNIGRGLKIDVGAAYRFVEHVDFRAAFNMSFGVPQSEVVYEEKDLTVTPNTTESETWTYHHAQYGVKLMLVPRFTAFDLIDVYIGAGLGIYWTSYSLDHSEKTIIQQLYEETVEIDTKASVPFIGMIGLEYPVSRALTIYLDGTYESMNVTVQELKVDKTTFPGGGGGTTPVKFEEDASDRAAPPKIPASNLAIRLGVRIPLF